ncbi:MAG: hypothetical protein V4463_07285 [Pseudomonadota bacterium]
MTMPFLRRRGAPLLFALGMLSFSVLLLMRSRGLHPFVFADELYYSTYARITALADAGLPSYLYLWIFGSTNACDFRFLSCARGLNIGFFVASAPFIYLTARSVCGRITALAITLLSMFGPVNSLTTYFMPESMYFFGFSVLAWVALTRRAMHWAAHALLAGAALGMMLLTKVHAVFLLPALCLFIAYARWRAPVESRWTMLAAPLLTAALALGLRFGLGYLLAGANGLHLFGAFYGVQAENANLVARLLTIVPDALRNGAGHGMLLALMFGLPLATLILTAVHKLTRDAASEPSRTLMVYTVLMLGAPLAMTIGYTASMYRVEGLRIHMRYYDFAFPLLLMVAGARIGAWQPRARYWLPAAIAAALAAAAWYGTVHVPLDFRLNFIDCPEGASLDLMMAFWLGTATLALWIWRQDLAARLFIFGAAPLMCWNAWEAFDPYLKQQHYASSFDLAGQYLRDHLTPADQKQLAIAGTELSSLMRAKFYASQADVQLVHVEKDMPLDLSMIPPRQKWLIVVGKHALPEGFTASVTTPDFQLVRLHLAHHSLGKADMSSKTAHPDLLASYSGFANPETWGRWSLGSTVTLEFKNPLPKHANLLVTAMAYGPNADQWFTATAGDATTKFRVTLIPQESLVRLQTDGKQRKVTFTIPQPISPKDIGASGDERKIGLGLMAVEVGSGD